MNVRESFNDKNLTLIRPDSYKHVSVKLEPTTYTFHQGSWWNWGATVKWDNMGLTKEKAESQLEAMQEMQDKYTWYVNFFTSPNDDIRFDKHHATAISGNPYDFLIVRKFYDILNTKITSLKFKFADNRVLEYVTVDALTDSSGFKDIINNPDNALPWWVWLIVAGIAIVIILVLFTVFIPNVLPIILSVVVKALIALVKLIFIAFKLVLWIPYLILIVLIKAVICKKKNKKFKLWNPFKLKK